MPTTELLTPRDARKFHLKNIRLIDAAKLRAVDAPELKLTDHSASIDYAQLRHLFHAGVTQLISKLERRASK